MKFLELKNNLRAIFLLVVIIFSPDGVYGQREFSASETAFDYVQMKRSVARQQWSKENSSLQELNFAISGKFVITL